MSGVSESAGSAHDEPANARTRGRLFSQFMMNG